MPISSTDLLIFLTAALSLNGLFLLLAARLVFERK
jgi:hypothetical protein